MKKSNGKTFSVADDDFQVSGWCGNRRKCVQVAIKSEGVAIRDSKDPLKVTLFFSRDEWGAFVKAIKSNQFQPKS